MDNQTWTFTPCCHCQQRLRVPVLPADAGSQVLRCPTCKMEFSWNGIRGTEIDVSPSIDAAQVNTAGVEALKEAIEKMRVLLLDLTAHNGLINYKHPKGRCVQAVGELDLDQLFTQLIEGADVKIKPLPTPDPESYDGPRPGPKEYAELIGLSTSVEFSPKKTQESLPRGGMQIQALLYPTELESQLRKILSLAKTAVRDAGTNVLYLVFGFLELYESPDSDRMWLAPLVSVPIVLEEGGVDPKTLTSRYSVSRSGEDLPDNQTLRERVLRDFKLTIPFMDDGESLEDYFTRIEVVIKNVPDAKRWRVRRQVTLGTLAFGNLALWSDLDTQKNPGLIDHALIKQIFTGATQSGSSGEWEDRDVDSQPEGSLPLVFDADASQHKAIIAALEGKSIVIDGPPGTGKSQTITNIIAAALSKGKKILFVSEKLAALEVVRRNLDRAKLSDFCLELHSNKTQKGRLLEDIRARMEKKFPRVAQLQAKLVTLQRQKMELGRYAELMGTSVGNVLGLTVYEVFWAAARRRNDIGDLASLVATMEISGAASWTLDDIESRRNLLVGLAEHYDNLWYCDDGHPWWGFSPNVLAPGDDEVINRTLLGSLEKITHAQSTSSEAMCFFGFEKELDTASTSRIREILDKVPDFPLSGDPALLSGMFVPGKDPEGNHSGYLITHVAKMVGTAKGLYDSACSVLDESSCPPSDDLMDLEEPVRSRFPPTFLSLELQGALAQIDRLERAIKSVSSAAMDASSPENCPSENSINSFIDIISKINKIRITHIPIEVLSRRVTAINQAVSSINAALARVQGCTTRWSIPFDPSLETIQALNGLSMFPGLTIGNIDEESIKEARRLAVIPPEIDKPLVDLERIHDDLKSNNIACEEAHSRCQRLIEHLDTKAENSERALAELLALSRIAAALPVRLIEFRKSTFEQFLASELLERLRTYISSERNNRNTLDKIFYLDALPENADLKRAISALRRKEGLLAWIDGEWRWARKLYLGVSKQSGKLDWKECASALSALASWVEGQSSFDANKSFKECFGTLYRGLDTDLDAISDLINWYQYGRAELAECPGLMARVDLSSIPAAQILELAAKANAIQDDANTLVMGEATLQEVAKGPWAHLGLTPSALREGWKGLHRVTTLLFDTVEFFSKHGSKDLSPSSILRLMEARYELNSASQDIELLLRSDVILREAGGDELGHLPNIYNGRWKDRIDSAATDNTYVMEAIHQAASFSSSNANLAGAEKFALASREFLQAYSPLESQVGSRPGTLATLIESARSKTSIARQVVEGLNSRVRAGASISSGFRALAELAEAREILNNLSGSAEILSALGSGYKGLETDFLCLVDTHTWGNTIIQANLPSSVQLRLLSSNAQNSLNIGRKLFQEIDDSCKDARAIVEGLSSFGPFSWDQWQFPVRKITGIDFLSEIQARLQAALKDPASVLRWSRYLVFRSQCEQEGLGRFIPELENLQIAPESLGHCFEFAVYQSIGRSIHQGFPELARFAGSNHDQIQASFRALDEEIIKLTGQALASQIDERTVAPEGTNGIRVGDKSEMHLLKHQIMRPRSPLRIRQLMKHAGKALQELKPCFMMGPLSVAQYLEQGALHFDMIIMDEASQMRPEEALGAVARGAQLIVVGDQNQLPPTSFFRRQNGVVSADEGESILDICSLLFPPKHLIMHYRSQHESLIAFSNHHFYGGRLRVCPSARGNRWYGVKFRYVKKGVYQGDPHGYNIPEAQRVADAVLEHMLKRPDESLGVVTLNQHQSELIEDILSKKLKGFPECGAYKERWKSAGWEFFVKNLENVQGDERDVIYISTTFGKAAGSDVVKQAFGPITQANGWRRLNVLFTRAKRRVELFTSMAPEDIRLGPDTPRGTKALREYLDFVKRGVLVSTDETDRSPDSDFEIAVANAITAKGYEVIPQLGVQKFRLDMVVRNPDRPGEYLAAIECDGATYHSEASVRDRDRIRQTMLEMQGWKGRIYRIWSTDWFYNPRKEIDRLLAFLEERRRLSQLERRAEEEVEETSDLDASVESSDGSCEEAVDAFAASTTDNIPLIKVGDQVTYFFLDEPNAFRVAVITDGATDQGAGLLNRDTPMAQALLRLSEDEDTGDLLPTGPSNQKTRPFRVIEVRPSEVLAIPLKESRSLKVPSFLRDNGTSPDSIESSGNANITHSNELGYFESGEIEALLHSLGGMTLLNDFPRILAESKGLQRLSGSVQARLEIELQLLANKGRISCSEGFIRLI